VVEVALAEGVRDLREARLRQWRDLRQQIAPRGAQGNQAAAQITWDRPPVDHAGGFKVAQDARQAGRHQHGPARELADLEVAGLVENAQNAPLLLGHTMFAMMRAEVRHDRLARPHQRHR